MAENARERSRLSDSLEWMLQAHSARMEAHWAACRPDSVFIIFRDYYLMVYVLQADVLVRALVAHKMRLPWLASLLLTLLSWPREIAIASGLLRMLSPTLLCDHVVSSSGSLLHLSTPACEHAVSGLSQALHWLVETWVKFVTPACQTSATFLQTAILANTLTAAALAAMAGAVRLAPVPVVAKILPAMFLSVAVTAASPLSALASASAQPHHSPAAVAAPHARMYAAVLGLMLVWALIDLARTVADAFGASLSSSKPRAHAGDVAAAAESAVGGRTSVVSRASSRAAHDKGRVNACGAEQGSHDECVHQRQHQHLERPRVDHWLGQMAAAAGGAQHSSSDMRGREDGGEQEALASQHALQHLMTHVSGSSVILFPNACVSHCCFVVEQEASVH
jgi:hypothetical protein